MTRILLVLISTFVFGCSEPAYVQSELSKAMWEEIGRDGRASIDFRSIAGERWDRVCFFGPYNEQSSEVLGFNWEVGEHTDVLRSDGHNVVVFATSAEVVEYVVHSRLLGDFWKLSGKCFPREDALFDKDPESGHWRNYVQAKS